MCPLSLPTLVWSVLPSITLPSLSKWCCFYHHRTITWQHDMIITLLSRSYKMALQVPPSSSKSMQRHAHLRKRVSLIFVHNLFNHNSSRWVMCYENCDTFYEDLESYSKRSEYWQKFQNLTASCSTETAFCASHKARLTLKKTFHNIINADIGRKKRFTHNLINHFTDKDIWQTF